MKIIKKAIILTLLITSMLILGCSNHKKASNESGQMKLDIEESPEENLEINLHVDYSEWKNGQVHTLKVKPYKGDDKKWVGDIANKYFGSGSADRLVVDPDQEKTMYILNEDNYFMVAPDLVWFYKHIKFENTSSFFIGKLE